MEVNSLMKKEEGISFNLISHNKLDKLSSDEKLKFILAEVKKGKILVLEQGLTPIEQTSLIECTMKEIEQDTFIGVEMEGYEQENPTLFSDPTKTFLDNSCGDGQFLSEVVIRKMERSGYTLEQALSTTYGVEFMEDNVIECRKRLAGPDPSTEILEIVRKNIVHHDALTYDYSFSGIL